jgi:Uma2 family endonuclease
MSAAPKVRLTPEQYLAIERKAERRSEYCDGRMTLMPATNFRHAQIKANLVGEVGMRLKGGLWHTLSTTMRVKVQRTGLYTYPDIVIVHDGAELEDDEQDTLLNPQVIIEVLSDSTEKYDRGKKARHYQQIASLREYVLVAQDEPAIERFVRQPDESWAKTFVEGLDREFAFATVPVGVPLADVYAGVAFPAAGESGANSRL